MEKKKRCLSKLVDLNKRVESLMYDLEDLRFQKEQIRELHDVQMQTLAEDISNAFESTLRRIEIETQQLCDSYSKAYQEKISDLKSRLDEKHDSKRSSLEIEAKRLSDALRDVMLTSNQMSHNAETALNALNVQVGMTKREIERDIQKAKLSGVSQMREQEELHKEKIRDLEQKHEVKKSKIEASASKEMIRLANNANQKQSTQNNFLKFLIAIREKVSEIGIEMLSATETIATLQHSSQSHMNVLKTQTLRLCSEISDIVSDVKTKEIGRTKAYSRLNEQLKANLAEIRSRNSQKIKEILAKIENLKVVLDIDIKEHYRIIDERGKAVLKFVQDQTTSLNALITQTTEELNKEKDKKNNQQKKRNDELSQLEAQLSKRKEDLEKELETIRARELAKQAKEFETDVVKLNTVFKSDLSTLEREFVERKAKEHEKHEQEMKEIQRKIDAKQREINDLRQTLETLKNWAPEEEEIAELDTSDIELLEQQHEDAFAKEAERNTKKIADLRKSHTTKAQDLSKQLEKRHSSAIHDIEQLFLEKSDEYIRIENEYLSLYRQMESELDAIPEVLGENDSLNKSGRIIESLKHQSYQLQSTMKFQRMSLESEWKTALDTETERHRSERAKFSDKFQKLQYLTDLQERLSSERQKTEAEMEELRRQKEQTAIESHEVEMEMTTTKLACDKAIEEMARLLSETKTTNKNRITAAEELSKAKIFDAQTRLNECQHEMSQALASIKSQMKESLMSNEVESETLLQKSKEVLAAVQDEINAVEEANAKSIRVNEYDFEIEQQRIREEIELLQKEKEEMAEFTVKACNERMSRFNAAFEDLEKANLDELEECLGKRKALVDFFEERIAVLEKTRSDLEVLVKGTGPRPAEREKITALQQCVRNITSELNELKKRLAAVKGEMVRRDKGYDHNFGKKPYVGTFGKVRNGATLPVRHSL